MMLAISADLQNRWATRGTPGRSLAYPRMRGLLDRFHANGLKDNRCLLNVHPETEENKEIVDGLDTSRARFSFSGGRATSTPFATCLGGRGIFVSRKCSSGTTIAKSPAVSPRLSCERHGHPHRLSVLSCVKKRH